MTSLNNTLACIATAAATLVGATAADASQLITNGDFETCVNSCPTNLTPLSPTMPQLDGWTISSNNGGNAAKAVEWVDSTGWAPYSGDYSIALSGANGGQVSQNVATQVGVTYKITFDVSGNPKNNGLLKSIGVGINGVDTVLPAFKDDSKPSNMVWVPETFEFTATSNSTLLSLYNAHPFFATGHRARLYGLALDDVRMQPVPEPTTWAMMMLGVAGVGGLARTRRRTALAV